MTRTEEEFLKIGVREYANADSTLDAFREKLGERLEAVLGAKNAFGDFERDGRAPVKQKFRVKALWGQWASATATGTVKGVKLGIEIGVWWPGRIGLPSVAFYVSEPDGVAYKDLGKPNLPDGLKLVNVEGDKPYLFCEPGAEPDFDQDFDRLIRAFALCITKPQP